jgi:hypothetical protein
VLAPEALPAKTETVGADGIITVVEYKLNDDGKKVKVRRFVVERSSKWWDGRVDARLRDNLVRCWPAR